MLESFFPRPKQFFGSFAVWSIICVVLWFTQAINWGETFSIGGFAGYGFPVPLAEDADDAAKALFAAAGESAGTFWFYQYMFVAYIAFLSFWTWYAPGKWNRWSVWGSALIIFVTWYQVQIDVMINEWFGGFYDNIQKALAEPNSVSIEEYYSALITFGKIALVAVTLAVVTRFFVSHFIFRWRTAMNDHYMGVWHKVRHIEGASQRVQEDTMRFAAIMEGLGVSLIDAVMTLVAFLPILWVLSDHVTAVPILGAVPKSLVWVAIIWSIVGTGILAVVGIRLPGLEFRNQRVEAAYRKELVHGEDQADRAAPPTVKQLFLDVRMNYFRLYFNYLYFNVARFAYLQVGVLVPYIVLAPTIIAAGFTLGVMQQVLRAFARVEGSFQFLVNSWTTIVELMSIYKRLAAFEAAMKDQPLDDIEKEVVPAE